MANAVADLRRQVGASAAMQIAGAIQIEIEQERISRSRLATSAPEPGRARCA